MSDWTDEERRLDGKEVYFEGKRSKGFGVVSLDEPRHKRFKHCLPVRMQRGKHGTFYPPGTIFYRSKDLLRLADGDHRSPLVQWRYEFKEPSPDIFAPNPCANSALLVWPVKADIWPVLMDVYCRLVCCLDNKADMSGGLVGIIKCIQEHPVDKFRDERLRDAAKALLDDPANDEPLEVLSGPVTAFLREHLGEPPLTAEDEERYFEEINVAYCAMTFFVVEHLMGDIPKDLSNRLKMDRELRHAGDRGRYMLFVLRWVFLWCFDPEAYCLDGLIL